MPFPWNEPLPPRGSHSWLAQGMSSNLLCFAARDHQASSDLQLFLCSFMIQECSLVITTAFCWLPAFTWVFTTPYPSFQPFYVKAQNLRRKVHQKYYGDAADLATPQRGDMFIFAGGTCDQLGRTLNQESGGELIKILSQKNTKSGNKPVYDNVSFEERFSRSRIGSPVKISQTGLDCAWRGKFMYLLVFQCEKKIQEVRLQFISK